MDFSPNHTRKKPGEHIVPMINVVFLLLIFFLMSAQIAPPPPVELTSPHSTSEQSVTEEMAVFVSADGVLFYLNVSADAAWVRLLQDQPTSLTLHVDANLPATNLAKLLPRLSQSGATKLDLVTWPAR